MAVATGNTSHWQLVMFIVPFAAEHTPCGQSCSDGIGLLTETHTQLLKISTCFAALQEVGNKSWERGDL
jgi:hypothetical protein